MPTSCRGVYGGANLCGTGTCVDTRVNGTVVGSLCSCPPGHIPDQSLFHTTSCIPSLVYLGFLLGAMGLAIPICTMLFIEANRNEGDVRNLLLKQIVLGVLSMTTALSMFIEQGWGVGASIIAPLLLATIVWVAADIVLIGVKPMYSMAQLPFDAFRRRANIMVGLTSCIYVVGSIPLAIFSTTNDTAFNALLFVALVFTNVVLTLVSAAAIWYAQGLDKVLAALLDTLDFRSPLFHDIKSLRDRVARIKRLFLPIQFAIFGILPFPLMWAITSYCPFQFVLLFNATFGIAIVGAIGFVLSRRARARRVVMLNVVSPAASITRQRPVV